MSLYAIALFLHVVGVLLLVTAFTAEGISLIHLRRVETSAQVTDWQSVAGLARVFGPVSVVAILVPGLYMMVTSWGWVPWIAAGLLVAADCGPGSRQWHPSESDHAARGRRRCSDSPAAGGCICRVLVDEDHARPGDRLPHDDQTEPPWGVAERRDRGCNRTGSGDVERHHLAQTRAVAVTTPG